MPGLSRSALRVYACVSHRKTMGLILLFFHFTDKKNEAWKVKELVPVHRADSQSRWNLMREWG